MRNDNNNNNNNNKVISEMELSVFANELFIYKQTNILITLHHRPFINLILEHVQPELLFFSHNAELVVFSSEWISLDTHS